MPNNTKVNGANFICTISVTAMFIGLREITFGTAVSDPHRLPILSHFEALAT
jgi:hypothetical protein